MNYGPEIGADVRHAPALQGFDARPEDLDFQRITPRSVTRMARPAIAARARRQRADETDLGKEFDEISRTHGARLHEVAVGSAFEACAHEYIEHIVDVGLCFVQGKFRSLRQRPREVRVAALVIIGAGYQSLGVGVAARANDIMNARAVGVEAHTSRAYRK